VLYIVPFARVANKGVPAYGTWKSVRKMGDRKCLHVGTSKRRRTASGEKDIWLEGVPPIFVSVASKGFTKSVSPLFAIFAGRSISVASKGLKAMVGRTVISR
jgi:hypothetical protein